MDSLGDLLAHYKQPQEPEEIRAVKQYIADEFGVPARVGLQGDAAIIIIVTSAALANTLRMRTPAIQQAAATTKRLVFRIS
jgi:hypothetical protein